MTSVPHSPNPYLQLYDSSGVKVEGGGEAGYTLSNGATYYVGWGDGGSLVSSVQITWSSAVVMVVTVWDTNHPTAGIHSTSLREWTQENPATAYIGGDGAGGMTATAMTATVAGGTASSAMFNLGNMGSLRQRLRLVVTTGGNVTLLGHARQ